MPYITSALVEFRELLATHIHDIERAYPERYSTEWFFLRYVKRVNRCAHGGDTPAACNGAMRGLTRFFVDQIEPDSDLAPRFDALLECHRYALRMQRLASTAETDNVLQNQR